MHAWGLMLHQEVRAPHAQSSVGESSLLSIPPPVSLEFKEEPSDMPPMVGTQVALMIPQIVGWHGLLPPVPVLAVIVV